MDKVQEIMEKARYAQIRDSEKWAQEFAPKVQMRELPRKESKVEVVESIDILGVRVIEL